MYARRFLTAATIAAIVTITACGAATSQHRPDADTTSSSPTSTRASSGDLAEPITVLPPAPPASGASATGASAEQSAPSTAPISSGATTSSRSSQSATSATPLSSTETPDGTTTATTEQGMTVVIDPGHNGANAAHPEIINKHVPAGFGQTKPCNTTGTSTNDGYAEHRFNWMVSLELKDVLEAHGITVVMTRDSDEGVGPCVNERAAIGNDARADAVISIHGDGSGAGVHGFFVMTASRQPADDATAAATDRLATDIRDSMSAAGFATSNGLGSNGIWPRSDLAGLNLSLRPTVMIECGNMRNSDDAAAMSSPDGQRRYAEAIADGVLAFLARTS